MDAAAPAGQLTGTRHANADGAVRFVVASETHDPAIRRLLRENPMAGRVRVSFEREPDYFSGAAIEGPEHRAIVAIENGRVVCMGSFSARMRYINGSVLRVGYLGGLRLDRAYRGRAGLVRRGYALFRELHEQGGPPIYLTSIVSDNLPARRLLERGLSGMPMYRFIGELVTLVAPVPRRLTSASKSRDDVRVSSGSKETMPSIAQLLRRDLSVYQFAPAWSEDELLGGVGPRPDDFRLALTREGEPIACAALWDQRPLKQVVVHGYSTGAEFLRPVLNLLARGLDRPGLPAPGKALSLAYISHLAMRQGRPELLRKLIEAFFPTARVMEIDYLIFALDARDPRLADLCRALRPRTYRSRIYAVHWEDGAELARSLDGRLLAPEAALL